MFIVILTIKVYVYSIMLVRYNIRHDACDVTLRVYPHRARLKNMPDHGGIFFKLARCGYTLRVTSQASYSPEYITPTQKNHEYQTCFP
jgi:hypothetical protein